ncbi:6-pyruvoyl trahydropterin synthase family protein [Teredinibacter haidensis]|uniref:6-pyruvoyl trahydropterin synthase family protein n=1 Tax=Teredinibacter haidensis TaxID=2731755 RepID=UPI000948967B|nr:6-carboxytetrahydropterin synthase [Teredinibacter haidensis]
MRLFVDNLTNIDFSFLDAQRGLVGETWLASVELDGTLDEQGMVCDFGIVKKKLREWLDTTLDHCLLVPQQSAILQLQEHNGSYGINWHLHSGDILKCASPKQAITLIDAESITAQSVAQWCIQKLKAEFPDTVQSLTLKFTCETIDGPYYHYSHGLKKHKGNCQRIAHGHRSKIEIWRNGNLSTGDMEEWAQQWKDIYIGTREDLCSTSESAFDPDNVAFAYCSQQGEFSLSLPKKHCYLIDTDSTVELIAQHIATQLKQRYPSETIVVKAYEGIGKGAIAQA